MRRSNHRAVAPIIATLLLVAIAVVGGTIIFVFSQGFFSQSQISGTPTIESVKILGYDARDVNALDAHDGVQMAAGTGGDPNVQGKNVDERVVVYIKNDSVGQILFSEIRFGGDVYTYGTETPISAWNSAGNISPGNYGILTNATSLVQNQAPVAKPGETVGIMIDLNDNFPIGRDTQFKLSTSEGAIFVGTVVMGQDMG